MQSGKAFRPSSRCRSPAVAKRFPAAVGFGESDCARPWRRDIDWKSRILFWKKIFGAASKSPSAGLSARTGSVSAALDRSGGGFFFVPSFLQMPEAISLAPVVFCFSVSGPISVSAGIKPSVVGIRVFTRPNPFSIAFERASVLIREIEDPVIIELFAKANGSFGRSFLCLPDFLDVQEGFLPRDKSNFNLNSRKRRKKSTRVELVPLRVERKRIGSARGEGHSVRFWRKMPGLVRGGRGDRVGLVLVFRRGVRTDVSGSPDVRDEMETPS